MSVSSSSALLTARRTAASSQPRNRYKRTGSSCRETTSKAYRASCQPHGLVAPVSNAQKLQQRMMQPLTIVRVVAHRRSDWFDAFVPRFFPIRLADQARCVHRERDPLAHVAKPRPDPLEKIRLVGPVRPPPARRSYQTPYANRFTQASLQTVELSSPRPVMEATDSITAEHALVSQFFGVMRSFHRVDTSIKRIMQAFHFISCIHSMFVHHFMSEFAAK